MHKKYLSIAPIVSLTLLILGLSTISVSAANDISNQVTHSYNVDASVQIGMIVQLKPNDPTTVIALNNKNVESTFGVVVPVGDSTITLTPQTSANQQVLVATSGNYKVLVSNQGGAIKPGDYITISAIDGIGMKASTDTNQKITVGQAIGEFNGTSNVISTVDLKDSINKTTKVAIGRISVAVQPASNPLIQNTTSLPSFVARAANGVANKQVSSIRLYAGIAILLGTLYITGSVLYSGVKSGILAVGRNPLAKNAIGRSLFKTIFSGIAIFFVGLSAIYITIRF
jgi:hypothetical protein